MRSTYAPRSRRDGKKSNLAISFAAIAVVNFNYRASQFRPEGMGELEKEYGDVFETTASPRHADDAAHTAYCWAWRGRRVGTGGVHLGCTIDPGCGAHFWGSGRQTGRHHEPTRRRGDYADRCSPP